MHLAGVVANCRTGEQPHGIFGFFGEQVGDLIRALLSVHAELCHFEMLLFVTALAGSFRTLTRVLFPPGKGNLAAVEAVAV